MTEPGLVSLVGSGPGDPGLIAVKGLDRLKRADVVVFDRLANPKLLESCKPGAELIDAGKGRGAHVFTQDEINALLIKKAKERKTVCRLKGGDPFVFGRGGEEALALAAAGIRWEVIPGITSAIGAAAYAGIPVTHRGVSTSFTVVTGSQDPLHHESGVEWDRIARLPGTLVILMGWESIASIVEALVAGGLAADRPAAVIQWGTLPRQKTVTGLLHEIAALAERSGLGSPAAIVIGDVTKLRDRMRWFDERPLFGKRVLVTRARSQASRLAALLEESGAECVEVPSIRIAPVSSTADLDHAIRNIVSYHWVTFTSPNGVRAVRSRMETLDMDARSFAGVKVASVGPATTQELLGLGIRPDLMPEDYSADSVVEAFRGRGMSGIHVIHFRSNIGRESLPVGLRELGAVVDEVVAYETHPEADSTERARDVFAESGGIDITTFSSSSAVKNLVGLLNGDVDPINRTMVACMGPATAAEARRSGVRVDVIAREQSIEGLVASVVEEMNRGSAG